MGLSGSSLAIPGGGSEGFHVLRVQDGSPGHKAGLEPYFDFIVSINGIRLDTDNDTFKAVLKENVNRPVELLVYNSKTQDVRKLPLTPHENWGGQVGLSIDSGTLMNIYFRLRLGSVGFEHSFFFI